MSLYPLDEKYATDLTHEVTLKRSETNTSNEEEQNYCRICRGEGTSAQPLYYPCKCSGSIKFVHQECLMEWLTHSQKKYCELCKTSFRFTKLYDRSMPAKLPFPLFIRQLSRHGLTEFARWTRYSLVGLIWTCCLPWCIRQVWRGLFWLADGSWPVDSDVQAAAEEILNTTATVSAPQTSQTLFINFTVPESLERIKLVFPPMQISLGDITRVIFGQGLIGSIFRYILSIFIPSLRHVDRVGNEQSSPIEVTATSRRPPSFFSDVEFISAWSSSPMVNNVTVDVIEGQLICVLLVTAFILVFLIREWVINQQPIMNMPDPDAADNPPQERPAENERPRMGLLRPRNRRQGGNANAEGEGAAVDPAARPIAIPRRRRALTDDNILNDTGNEIDRPILPMRSQSLLTNPEALEEADAEEAVGESSAVANDECRPVRRHSSSSYNTTQDSAILTSRQTVDTTSFDSSPPEIHGASTVDDASREFAFEQLQQPDGQQTERDERGPAEPSARRVSFAQGPLIIEERKSLSGELDSHENATDSDGPVIPTPDSSNDTDLLQPTGELLDADFQEALFDDVLHVEAEEITAFDDQEPRDDASFLGRISKWLWHTEIEDNGHAGTEARGNALAEGQDEERIVEDINAEAPFVPIHNRDALQIPPVPPAIEPPPAALVEPRDPNMFMDGDLNDPNPDDAEDLDGILELLGMEGPIFGMIQNVIFSLFLITVTLMVSVWCPYIWGKIALLFLSQPATMFVRAPLFVLSRSADIVVDIIFFVIGLTGFLLNQPVKIMKAIISVISPSLGNILDTTTIEGFTLDLSQKSGTRLERTLIAAAISVRPDLPTFSMHSHQALISFKTFVHDAVQCTASTMVQVQKALTTDRPGTRVLLASIGQTLRSVPKFLGKLPQVGQLASNFVRSLSTDLATTPTIGEDGLDPSLVLWNTEDRILAVIFGFALFAIAGIIFLEIAHLVLGLKDDEKVEGYFADSLRQAGGVMKVIVIIGIEMLAFPLYCGLLLDIALLPLFANATIASRAAFMMRTPLTGIFIHWFIGTCYMFHFALFVSICRKIMRRGVLYFIRDPDDPTFHPVRDVLERPVPAQLGKIAFSALVYGGLVTICLGGVVWSLDWFGGVLPIQWSTPEPRLAFPIDIIFYNFLLPFILRKAEPSKRFPQCINGGSDDAPSH